MWATFFSYPDPLADALVKRLVVLLVAGPWLVLLARSSSAGRSGWRLAGRAAFACLLFDQLMFDFRLMAPVVLAMAALWPFLPPRQSAGGPPAGAFRLMTAGLLIVAAALIVLVVQVGDPGPVRYAVFLFTLFSLFWVGPQRGAPSPERPAGTPKECVGLAGLYLIGALPFYWSIPEFNWNVFVQMLLAGFIGWTGVQFLLWRARRAAQGRPWPLRAVSWGCGLAAGLMFTLSAAEVYFRYVYDASDATGSLRTSQRWGMRHMRFNSWGYRDREFPPPEQLESFTRIVMLGDSFTFGWGIAQFEHLLGPGLERELAGKVSPPPRVFMLARGGIDTRQETKFFMKDGVRLRPRVVVLQYHLNDTEPLAPSLKPPKTIPQALEVLSDSSDFLEFFLVHTLLRTTAGSKVSGLPGMAIYQDPARFAVQAGDLLGLMRMIRDAGASPVVLMYPYLNAPTQEGPQRLALDRVSGLFAGAGVPVIDVSRLVNVNERKYHANPFDPHPSAALNAAVVPVLAQVVLEALARTPASAPATQPAL